MKSLATLIPTLVFVLAPAVGESQAENLREVHLAYAAPAGHVEPGEILSAPARLDVEGVRLVEALTRLQESSGIPVAYSPTLIPTEKIVSCACGEVTVEEALRTILRGTGFEFVVAAEQLVVRQKGAPHVRVASVDMSTDWNLPVERVESSLRQPAPPIQGTITGRVLTAETNRPLADVQISIEALQIGTLTNDQGRFLLQNVPAGQHQLSAERIGYQSATQTVDVPEGGSVAVNIALEQRAISLEGVVATGVAAQTPQSQVPFTVEQVSAAELQEVPQTSVGRMLQAKVAGVKIVQGSGTPGSEPSFQFRGPTSISGSQAPLIVIDGVITQGGIADLNPEDIASIEVVKGAAAAALYGSRAQAGVLQINTEDGAGMTEGENEIRVRTSFEANDIEHFLGVNGGNPWRVDAQGNFLDFDGNPVELPAEGRQIAFDDGGDGTCARCTFNDGEFPPPVFDPMRQFLDPGNRVKTHASVRGNAGGTRYYFSGAFEREQGAVTLLEPMKQRQARLNLTQPIGDDLTIRLTSYLSDRVREVTDEGGGTVEGIGRLDQQFVRALTFTTKKANLLRPDPDEPGGISAIGEPIDVGNVTENPVNRLINTDNTDERTRFIGGVSADYSPLSWLTVSGNLSFDRIDQDRLQFQRPGLTNLFGDPPTRGFILKEGSRREELNGSVTLATNRSFMDGDLTMRNRVRWLAERRDQDRSAVFGEDLAVDETPSLGIVTGTPTIFSNQQSVRSQGFFLINQFTYKNRYILDGLIRRDGSSLFGEEERWQTYGRLSAAWRVSQEPWFNVDFLTELKPRFSWGTSGGRPTFAAQFETFAVERGQVIPTTLGNADLKPETARELEFGLDAVIAERVRVSANYVDTKVEDQLLLVPLPSKQGFESQWQNAGTLESETYELSVEAAIIDRSDMRWTARVTADQTKNEITSLNRPAFEITNPGLSRSRMYIAEGESLGSFYGFQFLSDCAQFVADMPCDQFDVNDFGHLVWVGSGNTWRDGVANDLWGTSSTINGQTFEWGHPIEPTVDNPLSFTKLGESAPDLNLGVRQDFQWRNLAAAVVLDVERGAQIYNFSQQWQCRDMGHCKPGDMRGVPDGEKKPITYFSALQAGNSPNDYFAQDADYVKLREVSLSYTVPRDLLPDVLQQTGLDEARINLTGRNLKTWTDYPGFDPEVGTDSFGGSAVVGRVDEWFIPNFRSVGIDVELVF